MHVLGLWFYDLFTNISVIYIYWNLEYLLFIFSIIYNLKGHRKILLLIWLLPCFVITLNLAHPRKHFLPVFPITWHQSRRSSKFGTRREMMWDDKLCVVEIKTLKSLFFNLFRWLCFSRALGFTTWNSDQHSRVISYLCLLLRKWFRL